MPHLRPLKSNHCYAVVDRNAEVCAGGAEGVFLHDTRHLSDYRWDIGPLTLLAEADAADTAFRHFGLFEDRAQLVSVARTFRLLPDGFEDELLIANESAIDRDFAPSLSFDADFRDIFEVRGRERATIGRNQVQRDGAMCRYLAQDGVSCETALHFLDFVPGERFVLKPGETRRIAVRGRFRSSRHGGEPAAPAAPWTRAAIDLRPVLSAPARRAFDDIDMLMATSPQGPLVLTGVPYYVTLFGRDSLITSWFLLAAAPDIAQSTLRGLAAHQGKVDDPVTLEAPGKIAHEIRDSELARTGDVPYGRYYGTADASALYVLLIRDHWKATGRTDLVAELAEAWRGAIAWCRRARAGDGLLRYACGPHGRGLVNNSWKDSKDSMSYGDGRLAAGPLAVVEVQGYLAAALDAAAELEQALGGEQHHIETLHREAAELRDLIDTAFWNDDLGIHAIAVDEDGRQCDVVSSNPGHLLWAGVLSAPRAAAVADRLMQPDMWTGWGVRSLSMRERRYQPLSYHNGSVWPHDNGMIAAGAARYRLTEASDRIWRGMDAVAAAVSDLRLPELFGGYDRQPGRPPIPYAETCSPQAWAAAAMVFRTLNTGT
ncbi:MAG TPA: amylo-alpha-1,6-glucosidase [Rhodobacteraceae bacterium]|nr:amylo-alpha-1,6-glucosidase [Paracoccaceae bacterium]